MILGRALGRVRRGFAVGIALVGTVFAAACSEPGADHEAAGGVETPLAGPAEEARALPGSLEWAADGEWRLPGERNRDAALHRIEVARLFGLDRAESILELDPGAGAWTAVIAPAAASRAARYRAALSHVALAPTGESPEAAALAQAFRDRFADPALYGVITVLELGPSSPPLGDAGSIDAAFAVDAVAAWMAFGYAEKAFTDVFAALEPGGRFGMIAPRAPRGGAQDPGAANGYVQQAYVIRMAEEAGFTLESASELLANPNDDADHPFGVWTLAPYRLTAPLGAPADPSFDRAPFDAIGEPDRMTLLFRKPRG
jgi:predicted methyltransferase